jgi:hypothetical protein
MCSDISNSACPSYLTEIESAVTSACKGKEGVDKEVCVAQERDRLTRCGQVATEEKCGVNPNFKIPRLRSICTTVPTRLECTSLQIGCAKTPNEEGCSELKAKCAADPNRIDGKEAAGIRAACANDPNKPECKDVPKTAAPTLAPEEETTEEPGAEETQEPEAGGETTDPGTTGGEAPSTGGGTGETPAPEAGVPTE